MQVRKKLWAKGENFRQDCSFFCKKKIHWKSPVFLYYYLVRKTHMWSVISFRILPSKLDWKNVFKTFENRLGLNSIHLFHFFNSFATLCVVTQDKNCVRTEDQCAVNGALSNTCTHVLGRGTVNIFLCNMEKRIRGCC